ncbi:hypothetical protein PHPALM_28294 [Phytophthora palmivora]|uniref:Reverse transcriptase domain-containing protein n=1 Tax=Phytophthora palmivora TaxID=4796 RepID=A0A2P4XAG3_9STRA|nr:hypothetical protein PHPALM_28294 [Phytophthora palmivora]
MSEDVLEGFTKQRAARLGILKNPEDPVYPFVKESSDVSEVIDAFFAEKVKSGMQVVLAQTPIPRKDVLLNNMSGCTIYSAVDLVDGYYQILMRESDIPVTAASTLSATFNRLVTRLFRPLRTFAQTYFDDIFIHSRVENGQTAMKVHLKHLRRVFEVMRANQLYANIDKCDFAVEEIKVIGCFVNRRMATWLSFFAEYNFRVEYKPAYQADENYPPLVRFLSEGKDAKVDRLSPR